MEKDDERNSFKFIQLKSNFAFIFYFFSCFKKLKKKKNQDKKDDKNNPNIFPVFIATIFKFYIRTQFSLNYLLKNLAFNLIRKIF